MLSQFLGHPYVLFFRFIPTPRRFTEWFLPNFFGAFVAAMFSGGAPAGDYSRSRAPGDFSYDQRMRTWYEAPKAERTISTGRGVWEST